MSLQHKPSLVPLRRELWRLCHWFSTWATVLISGKSWHVAQAGLVAWLQTWTATPGLEEHICKGTLTALFCVFSFASRDVKWVGRLEFSTILNKGCSHHRVTQQEDKTYLTMKDAQQRERKQKRQFLPSSSAPLGTHIPTSASSVKCQGDADNRYLLF